MLAEAMMVVLSVQLPCAPLQAYYSFCPDRDLNCLVKEYTYIRETGRHPWNVQLFYLDVRDTPRVLTLPCEIEAHGPNIIQFREKPRRPHAD